MCSALPQFKRPPINEVAIGVRFLPPEGLHQVHFGLFWAQVREEFNKSQEAAPLTPFNKATNEFELGLPPRTWLVHKDGEHLIQLQRDAFFFNWRRASDENAYPRYASIKPKFEQYFRLYRDFLEHESVPAPDQFSCSLAYVNLIPQESNEGAPTWFDRVFLDMGWEIERERFLPNPKGVLYKTTFDLESDLGELVVTVQSAKLKKDERRAFRFELNAQNQKEDLNLNACESWFDSAHEVIVNAFADLTSEEAQQHVWKRIDRG
jgi:uncharacterized protein (TIGR04255 family)